MTIKLHTEVLSALEISRIEKIKTTKQYYRITLFVVNMI